MTAKEIAKLLEVSQGSITRNLSKMRNGLGVTYRERDCNKFCFEYRYKR